MLKITERIQKLYEDDEFKIIIVEGDHGYGKSSYANNAIAETYSSDGKKGNWEIRDNFSRHIGFHPAHVLDLWMAKRKRDKVFHWDDAGLWLHSLDFQDPFVKAVGKYLQVARTDWACIIFTCIDKDDITKKIRGLRHAVTVEITKNSDKLHPNRRIAEAVTYYKTKKGEQRWNPQWEEEFNCWMPNTFYEWYNPLRERYATMAKELMKKNMMKKKEIVETSYKFLDTL